MIAGLRLAISLLTIVPVRAPAEIDRRRAGWAMTLAPVVALGLGLVTAAFVFGLRYVLSWSESTNLLPALGGLALLAVLTGGLHLDGFADLVDGLGARRDREGTLAVMREPGVGSFAVVALVLLVGVQASTLTLAIERHHGTVAVLVGLLSSRVAITLACAGRTPPARPGGLGALVLGSVPRARAAVVLALGLLAATLAGRFEYHGGGPAESAQAAVALLTGVAAAFGVRWLAMRKLGGLNGDVLGAMAEVAMTTTLVVVALRVSTWLQ